MRLIRTAAGAAGVLLLLAGCTSSTSKPVTATSTPASSAPVAPTTSKPAASPTPAKGPGIGTTVDLNSTKAGNTLEVTLAKVVDPAAPVGSALAPQAGSRYVAVQLRITNKGHDVYNQDPLSLVKAVDALGESFRPDVVNTTAGPLMDPTLNLAPGDTALGFLVFQVPAGQKVTRVQYTLSMLGGAVAQWTIG